MTTKSRVLTLLMKQAPNFISGENMAQQLNISRTAIWKAINELKKEGHQINSTKHKGYLYQQSDVLSSEGIYLSLKSNTPIQKIQVMEHSESTMLDAKLIAIQSKSYVPTLIVANDQQHSKGRFGRSFFAKKNAGIYMSLVLKPNQSLEEIAQYTIITAVAVSRAIDCLIGTQTDIKWVNDIYLNDKKICGILSEAISNIETRQISTLIIGIGINFSLKNTDFPEELQKSATSLFSETKPTITRNQLIGEIWNQFYQIIDQLPNQLFLEEYKKKSFVLGKKITFSQSGQSMSGVAKAINSRGELIVQLNDGHSVTLSSGEISLSTISKSSES